MSSGYPSHLHSYKRPDANLELFEAFKAIANHIRVFAEWLVLISAAAYGAARLQSVALHLIYLGLYFGFVMHFSASLGAWYRKQYWPQHAKKWHGYSTFRRMLAHISFVLAVGIAVGFLTEFIEKVIDDLFEVQKASLDNQEPMQRSKRLGPDWLLPKD